MATSRPTTRTHPDSFVSRSERLSRPDQDSASRDDLQMSRLASSPLKFIRFTAVRERTGLSRSTIWRLERRGAFPKHHHISANTVGWLEEDVNDWMLSKLKNA